MRLWAAVLVVGFVWGTLQQAGAEVCTTQSQMKDADRSALRVAATQIATKIQANDVSGVKPLSVAELAGNFAGMQTAVNEVSPKLKGVPPVVDQVYFLDGTEIKGGGTGGDAQFFCTLNRSAASVDFLIAGLSPGVYGFAVVEFSGVASPWRLAMLLRRDGGNWLLAGLYPRATTAAGHDGLWYWREARRMAQAKQRWNAWLYFSQAETLLKPANFVQSTHLEKLRDEQRAAAPPALSAGIGSDTPLVVKGADGREFQFTGLGTDDTLGKEKIDVLAHLKVDGVLDTVAARKRNEDGMRALLTAYPELRNSFHGVWVFADPASGAPFATEETMQDLR